MLAKSVGDQHHAHQQQERERQHLDGRMAIDIIANHAGRGHHDAHRDDHRGNHDPNFLHQTHRRNHAVQRKDNVDHDNLRNDTGKGGPDSVGCGMRLAFKAAVDLMHTLPQQKYPAQN